MFFLDAGEVEKHFTSFVHRHNLNSHQLQFLRLLQNYISKYGAITIAKLYEAPFTTVNSQGLDGVFTDEAQAEELIQIVSSFGGTDKGN